MLTNCTASSLQDRVISDGSIKISLSDENLVTYLHDTTVLKFIRIVKLETMEKSFLRKIDKIYVHHDTIFVFDKSLNKIFIFNPEGKYLSSIQRLGKGPFEYLNAMDFCLDTVKRQIILLCDRPYKFIRFDFNGNPIKEYSINELFLNIAIDDNWIYCNRPDEINRTKNDHYEFVFLDMGFNVLSNSIPTRKITNTVFYRGNCLSSSKSVYYTRRFENAIYQVERNTISQKYIIDFAKYSMPAYLIEKNAIEFSKIVRDREYVYSILNVLETDHHLLFGTNLGIFVYHKSNKKMKGYKSVFNTKIKMGTNSFLPVGCSDNWLVTFIKPEILTMIKEKGSDNREALNLAKDVDEEDNPILCFYKLK